MTNNIVSSPSGATVPTKNDEKSTLLNVAVWPRNAAELHKVVLDTGVGHPTIAIHAWWLTEGGDERRGRGITMSLKHLDTLIGALQRSRVIAAGYGLLELGGAA